MGNLLVPIIMFGWIPVVLCIFARFPAQNVMIISFIIAWLFLPIAAPDIAGLPNLTEISATCYGILLSTITYDIGRFSSFRFGWIALLD